MADKQCKGDLERKWLLKRKEGESNYNERRIGDCGLQCWV